MRSMWKLTKRKVMIMMRFKALLLFLLLAVFILPQAAVASADSGSAVTASTIGIAPDSIFYPFDKLLDNIGLAFTFDSGEKAGKAMVIARERFAESVRMMELGKLDAARTAQAEHARALSIVENAVRRLQVKGDEASLLKESKIEIELGSHEIEIEEAKDALETGGEKQDMLNIILVPIQLKAAEARARVAHDTDSIVVINDGSAGRSSEGVQAHASESRRNSGRSGTPRIQARVFGGDARVRVEVDFSTSSTERDAVVSEMLEMLNLGRADIERALDLEVETHHEELRERLRAKARHRDGITRAELRLEFPLSTNDRQAIIDGISEKLGSLTAERISNAMTLEMRGDRAGAVRGREGGDVDDVRGRGDEGEIRGRDDENEVRGRDSENELRGREAEGEAPRGADDSDDDDDGVSHNRRGRGRSGGDE